MAGITPALFWGGKPAGGGYGRGEPGWRLWGRAGFRLRAASPEKSRVPPVLTVRVGVADAGFLLFRSQQEGENESRLQHCG